MSSVGQVMRQEMQPLQLNCTAGEAAKSLEQLGLTGLPVVDNNHKLIGMVFRSELLGLPEDTPLVKW